MTSDTGSECLRLVRGLRLVTRAAPRTWTGETGSECLGLVMGLRLVTSLDR